MLRNLAQFKLASGHEIICELIDIEDETLDSSTRKKTSDNEILTRNVLMIIPVDYNGERKFLFRPFLQYVESNDDIVILNTSHIVSMNRPNVMLINDYKIAMSEYHREHEERKKEYAKEVAKHLRRVKSSFERKIRDWTEGDSAGENDIDYSDVVIPFPSKHDKIH